MMATTGIAGNQGARRTVATDARNAGKARLKKIAPWLIGIIVVSTLGLWWRNLPDESPKMSQAPGVGQPQRSTATVPAPGTTSSRVEHVIERTERVTATWNRMADDGSIPVNTPSEEIPLPVRCFIDFGATPGYGTIYEVDYGYAGIDWKRLKMGEHTDFMSKIRVIMLQPGQKAIGFTMECMKRPY